MALTKVTDRQVTYTHGGTDSEVRNLGDKLRESVSVKDFGASPDATAAVNNAAFVAALAVSDSVFVPAGTYLVTGNINVKAKRIYGEGKNVSIIKLSGTNTNTSLFINGGDSNTAWGAGGGCQLSNLQLEGNWDGGTVNPVTDLSLIGGLVKWWGGAYVQIQDCIFYKSFGFGIFSNLLGYSFINTSSISTNAKNGIHLAGNSGNEAITSTSINNCSVNSCRGRAQGASTGGAGIYVRNGFMVSINNTTLEDLDDGVRFEGEDNRSNLLLGCHIESTTTACVNYQGSGLKLSLLQNIFATQPALLTPNPQFQTYKAIGNYGLADVLGLTVITDSSTEVYVDSATPQATLGQVTLDPGTWMITANWTGSVGAGLGSTSATQVYALNTTAAIPGYSSTFNKAVCRGETTPPLNGFSPLQGSLNMVLTVDVSTTIYLYGGPESISVSLVCALAGNITAVNISGVYQ